MKAKGLSPVQMPDLESDPFDGLVGRGRILPELKLLENVDIGLVLDGRGIGIEAVISAGDLSLPGSFQAVGGMIRLYAGAGGSQCRGPGRLRDREARARSHRRKGRGDVWPTFVRVPGRAQLRHQ